MIKSGNLQLELFEQSLAEVRLDELRYVLRRNPERRREMQRTRGKCVDHADSRCNPAGSALGGRCTRSLQPR